MLLLLNSSFVCLLCCFSFVSPSLKKKSRLCDKERLSFLGSKFTVNKKALSQKLDFCLEKQSSLGAWGGGRGWERAAASPNVDGILWFFYASLSLQPAFCFLWIWLLTTEVSRRKPRAAVHGCCQFYKLLFQFTFSKHLWAQVIKVYRVDSELEKGAGERQIEREGCCRWDWKRETEKGWNPFPLVSEKAPTQE